MFFASQIRQAGIIRSTIFLLILVFSVAAAPIASAGGKPPARTIPGSMSCGVCGMFPAKFDKWQTQIIFTDGAMVPFDGAKDMFKYILDMANYDKKHTAKDLAAVWVKDFNNGQWLDGTAVSYVVNSSEMGPMGKELIPFGNPKDALAFKKEKSGMIMNYDDVTMDDIKKLGGMKMKGMKM